MKMGSRTLTVVLPHSPEDKDLHEQLVAASCDLYSEGGWAALQVLQLAPPNAAVTPLGAGNNVEWWTVECSQLSERSEARAWAQAAASAMSHPALAAQARFVVWPAGPLGEEAAASLAAELHATAFGRCSGFAADGDFVAARRAAFGGRVSLKLASDSAICSGAWRPQGEASALRGLDPSRVRRLTVEIARQPDTEVEALPTADGQVGLEGARLVVSGGRGMAGTEGFQWLSRIAGSLEAGLGGSLPAVDAGWVPVARQVGQSGRFVSPRLYFAVAISGTPQHLAGIANTTRIVALNRDPEAPIFNVADVGVVGDWQELLPLLAKRLEARGMVDAE